MSDITVVNTCFGVPDENGKVGYVPLGALYVSAVLEQAGYDVDFRDYLVLSQKFKDPLDTENFLALLQDSANIIGIGSTSATLPFVILAVEELKNQYPEKTVILGGIGPTGVAEEILKAFPFIDFVVRGEGEATIVDLVKNLHGNYKDIPGIGYRNSEKVCINPARERIRNLDELTFPAYDKVDLNNYSIISITASRGCPFVCTFCDTSPFWGRKNVSRSVDSVLSEIRFLYEEKGVRSIEFVDDTFVLNKDWVIRLCQQLKEEQIDIEWTCCGKVGLMDQELMAAMADSGCTLVFYGIESASNRVLKRIRKGFTREQAEETIKMSKRFFNVMPSFIWGYPFESMDDLNETLELFSFAQELECIPWLFALCPLPLSDLYQEYKENLTFHHAWCCNMAGTRRAKEIIELITRYPSIFPGFYHYESKDFEKKFNHVVELGFMDPNTPSAYLNGLVVSKWEN